MCSKILKQGGQKRFRMKLCADGELTDAFFSATRSLLHNVDGFEWKVVRRSERTAALALVAFRMLSRGAGSLHSIMHKPFMLYPFRLFGAMDDNGFIDPIDMPEPSCVFDSFTESHLRDHPHEHLLNDRASAAKLVCIANMAAVDIAKIECRHASIRKLALFKSLTRQKELQSISADWMFMRQRVINAGPFASQSTVKARKSRKSRNSRKKKRQLKKEEKAKLPLTKKQVKGRQTWVLENVLGHSGGGPWTVKGAFR